MKDEIEVEDGGQYSELEELRERISELEHLVTLPSFENNNSSVFTENVNLSTIRFNRMVERVSQLETLLAASEVENKGLKSEVHLLRTREVQQGFYNKEQMKSKDCYISELENKLELRQAELKRSEIRLENVTEYINSLPSEDELNDAKQTISRFESDNFLLREKGNRMQDQIRDLKKELIDKEKLYQSALARVEYLKPLEEAQKSLLTENISGENVDVEKLKEIITVERAQLLTHGQLIESLRRKLSHCDMEKCIGLSKISELTTRNASLEEDINYSRFEIEKLTEKIKGEVETRRANEEKCTELQNRIEKANESYNLQRHHFGNFVRLMSEIDLCSIEISSLIDLCLKLGQGEELPIDDLVGLDIFPQHDQYQTNQIAFPLQNFCEQLSESDIEHEHQDSSMVDLEWLLKSLTKVTEIRKNTASIKVRVMDFYVDIVGGKFEGCSLQ